MSVFVTVLAPAERTTPFTLNCTAFRFGGLNVNVVARVEVIRLESVIVRPLIAEMIVLAGIPLPVTA